MRGKTSAMRSKTTKRQKTPAHTADVNARSSRPAKPSDSPSLVAHEPITAIDLYAGCGSVTAGFKNAGINVVAAVDFDPVACETYSRNHPTTLLVQKDIRKVSPQNLKHAVLEIRQLDVLAVCAPCQPFSNQNQHKGEDSRKNLILESVRFAKVLRPKLILFENVPGLAGKNFSYILEKLESQLVKLGYELGEVTRIDAADYGVPQRRLRCILLAGLGFVPPSPPDGNTPQGARETVAKAFQGLKRLSSGETDPQDPMHFARKHSAIALERLSHISKDGGSRFELPPHLVLACHKRLDVGRMKKSYPDVYGRMKWNDIAPTLTTGCTDLTRGRFAHPEDNRAITLREAARLQTFPDDYEFAGLAGQIAVQIGNAVPMKLVEAISPTIKNALGIINRR